MKLPHAETLNYWKTSQSSPDVWLDRTKAEITAIGGMIANEAYGRDSEGRAAFLLEFTIRAEHFRVIWPVLPTQSGKAADERAAKVQAATMLYHDIKTRCISAQVHGARATFFQFLLLPDGRTAAQLTSPELSDQYPKLLTSG